MSNSEKSLGQIISTLPATPDKDISVRAGLKMPSLNTILDTYLDSKQRFKKALELYAKEITIEFNNLVPMGLDVKTIEFELDHLDIEIIIGNNVYSFIICVYAWASNAGVDDGLGVYQLIRDGTGPRLNISLNAPPKEIAKTLIRFIDPQDIVKSRAKKR